MLVAIPLSAEMWALLVGINDYPNDISPLRYCVADVEAFRQALVQTAAYKPENVHLMTDQMSARDLPGASMATDGSKSLLKSPILLDHSSKAIGTGLATSRLLHHR